MNDSLPQAKPILERFKLTGRVALITGAGQGIGRAYAHALGEAGSKVAVVDVARERAEQVANELTSKGIDAIALRTDVTQADEVQAMVDSVVAQWGQLDIGVNNAGMGMWRASESMTPDEWDTVMNLNLRAVFLCCQAEARAMLPRDYGKIINTASMSGRIVNTPQPQAAYNASKAGVIHLTKSLAAEWALRGVRVNCISPGYTRTPPAAASLATPEGAAIAKTWFAFTPMQRMAEEHELQGALVYLASEASDFATGLDLVVDGGYSLW
jgi:NAD(P)-dependent dehydrogenase (short-subunit alcohol dehydrogenase family)